MIQLREKRPIEMGLPTSPCAPTELDRRDGSAIFVRLFKPRFARLVEYGCKWQTVRPTPKRMPQPGDGISLREWTGKPYRSKQRVLKEATISRVSRILIAPDGELPITVIPFGPTLNYWPSPDEFARADGFEDWPAMRKWFEETHGLPFRGVLIEWQNNRI